MRRSDLGVLFPWMGMIGIALVGCATPSKPAGQPMDGDHQGAVSYHLLPALASTQQTLKLTEHAFGAQPTSRVNPVYPPSLTSQHIPPATVRIKAIVDERGKVTEARDLDPSLDQQHTAFVTACRDAVTQWIFSPMIVVNESDDGNGNITQTRSIKAFSQDYEFRFEIVRGAPTVSADR